MRRFLRGGIIEPGFFDFEGILRKWNCNYVIKYDNKYLFFTAHA